MRAGAREAAQAGPLPLESYGWQALSGTVLLLDVPAKTVVSI